MSKKDNIRRRLKPIGMFLMLLFASVVASDASDLWSRNAATNVTYPTNFLDLVNVTSFKVNNQLVCLADGTNCPSSATGNGTVRSVFAGAGLSGGNITGTGTLAVIDNGHLHSISNITNLRSSVTCTGTNKLSNVTILETGINGVCTADVTTGDGNFNSTMNLTIYNDNATQAKIESRQSNDNLTLNASIGSLLGENKTKVAISNVSGLESTKQCGRGLFLTNMTFNGGVTTNCTGLPDSSTKIEPENITTGNLSVNISVSGYNNLKFINGSTYYSFNRFQCGSNVSRATATQMYSDIEYVWNCTENFGGVLLPIAETGREIVFRNDGASSVRVWAQASQRVGTADNASVGTGTTARYYAVNSSQWLS